MMHQHLTATGNWIRRVLSKVGLLLKLFGFCLCCLSSVGESKLKLSTVQRKTFSAQPHSPSLALSHRKHRCRTSNAVWRHHDEMICKRTGPLGSGDMVYLIALSYGLRSTSRLHVHIPRIISTSMGCSKIVGGWERIAFLPAALGLTGGWRR